MATSQPETKRKHRHIFRWVFLAMQVVFLLWVILGAHAGQSTNCGTGMNASDCQSAKDAGTTIGVGIVVALWVAADVIVGGTYLIYRLASRKR